MKQEKTPVEQKVVSLSHSTVTPPSRPRASSLRTKDTPRAEVSLGLKARTKPAVPPSPDPSVKVRRSLGLNKSKSCEDHAVMASQKTAEVRALGRSGNRPFVEQFLRPRRRASVDLVCKKNEDVIDSEKKELQERLSCSENLVKNLQSEVLELKAELESLHKLNMDLQSRNNRFVQDLAVAEAKISAISSHHQRETVAAMENHRVSNFKDVQKLIANKLENMAAHKNVVKEGVTIQKSTSKPIIKAAIMQPKAQASSATPSAMPPPPPPPPPPPLPRLPSRVSTTKQAPTLVEFYHTLTKREGRKDTQGIQNNRVANNNAHNSIVGEIQNRSAHLLAIKLDVETKGEFIKSLNEKIQTAAYSDVEDVSRFVDWLDRELSTLADERAVLKHFNWPERKADAMREAAIEYRDLIRLENEVCSYRDDFSMPCEPALKKIAGLLDKSERSIQRLIKLRDSTMVSYKDCNIPIDWMLDSGMVHKIKKASMKLAKMYMERVSMELQSVRNLERESTQEALLLQGVRFAYRAHQFTGGLDSETMCAFEEIRQRVPMNVGGPRELLAGIASS